jgi:hypothetical protein
MASAVAAASWRGAGAPTVKKSCTFRMAFVSSGGARHQPIRHPVTLQVLESPEMVTVRSRMPSSAAMLTCSAPS